MKNSDVLQGQSTDISEKKVHILCEIACWKQREMDNNHCTDKFTEFRKAPAKPDITIGKFKIEAKLANDFPEFMLNIPLAIWFNNCEQLSNCRPNEFDYVVCYIQ